MSSCHIQGRNIGSKQSWQKDPSKHVIKINSSDHSQKKKKKKD